MNPEGRKRDATAGAKLWTSTDSGATWTEGLEIARKRLTGVIAPVGRGKSILLAELQTEAQREAGSVWARGDRSRVHDSPTQLAYCSQQPFIMQATVKENIVCDRPWSATRYRLAIESCALLEDIQSFGNKGDETEIGENGLNLSRGAEGTDQPCESRVCECGCLPAGFLGDEGQCRRDPDGEMRPGGVTEQDAGRRRPTSSLA